MSSVDLRDTFFMECEDLLEAMEEGLRIMSDGDADSDTVNSVFRAVHSIKGGAGAFKLTELVSFAHGFETVLDHVRSDKLVPTDDVMRILMSASDQLADLVHAAAKGDESGSEQAAAILAQLEVLGPEEEDIGGAALVFQPMGLDFGPIDLPDLSAPAVVGEAEYIISFAPNAAFYRAGHDPAVLFRNLAEIGKLTIDSVDGTVPPLDSLDPCEGYLAWNLRLHTDSGEAAIHEILEFAQDLCPIDLRQAGVVGASAPVEVAMVETTPFVESAAVAAVPEPVLKVVPDVPKPEPRGEPKGEPKSDGKSSGAGQTVRVDLDKVDRLINAVGELVINQAVLSQAISRATISDAQNVESGLDSLRNLIREIQEGVMSIRAQPVKAVFQRMFRICREAGDAAGKQVALVTVGEMTEVDKTVIERLTDPLTHMIRNSVDHGIESAEKRIAAGKPPVGEITLSAAHRSGRVVIEVADDGAGINRARVHEIAVSKGLVPPDVELSPAEIDALLFLPGFSTAKEVSALSGRGVGMDVVKRAIQGLGGRVSINSTPGKGTVFTISLPLTLAVLDGMIVEVAGEAMVVPITAIVETLRPNAQHLHKIGATNSLISVRGAATPVIDLGYHLGFRPPVERIEDGVLLLVETETQTRSALIVDKIHDQRQVVIKSLETNYRHVPGISAATILGNGRIALIVDPDQLTNPETGNIPENPQLLAG